MGKSSRDKGKRGERELAALLRSMGFDSAMYNYGDRCPIAAALIRKYEDEECNGEKSKSR